METALFPKLSLLRPTKALPLRHLAAMGIDVWSAIYLGTVADLDTNEGTLAGEGASALLTSYGSSAAPISDNVVDVTTNSADDVMTRDNAGTSDTLSFETSPGGPTDTTTIDSIYNVVVEFTFADNSTFTLNGAANVVQDTDGNLFLVVEDFVGGVFPKIFNDQIVSVSIESINDDAVPSLNQGSYGQQNFNSTSAGPSMCFLPGTRILTPSGEVPVEALGVRDLVVTLDDGPQPILWRGQRRMNFAASDPRYKPYRIKAGSLGHGLPRRDLRLSRQHRVMVDDRGEDVLAPACGLSAWRGVSRMNGCRHVEFHTLLLPRHSIIFAEGAPVETLYPGAMALATLDQTRCDEILRLLPGVEDDVMAVYGAPCRRVLTRREALEVIRLPPPVAA